jgi:hypothetical protein
MTDIKKGSRVLARTSSDRLIERRATTGVVDGSDFPVVWICPEQEWQEALVSGREQDSVPWPAWAVQAVEGQPATA